MHKTVGAVVSATVTENVLVKTLSSLISSVSVAETPLVSVTVETPVPVGTA
jgi:hypothetical protein